MPTPPCKKKEVQTSEYPKVTQLLDKRGAVIGVVVQCAPHADDWVRYRPSPKEPRSGSWEAGPFAEPYGEVPLLQGARRAAFDGDSR